MRTLYCPVSIMPHSAGAKPFSESTSFQGIKAIGGLLRAHYRRQFIELRPVVDPRCHWRGSDCRLCKLLSPHAKGYSLGISQLTSLILRHFLP